MSPWPRWNSTDPSSGHSIRPSPPKYGRRSRSPDRVVAQLRGAEHQEGGVPQEDQPAARAQEARRLGDPAVRVAPDRGAVLADGEVERGVREGDRLGARLEEREDEAVLPLERPRRLQLRRRDVDADRSGSPAGEPGGDVRGPAAELDRVEAGHVRQDPRLRLGHAPEAPARLRVRPGAPPRLHVGSGLGSSSRRDWRRRGRAARGPSARRCRSWRHGSARRTQTSPARGRACRLDRGAAVSWLDGQGRLSSRVSAMSVVPTAKT